MYSDIWEIAEQKALFEDMKLFFLFFFSNGYFTFCFVNKTTLSMDQLNDFIYVIK